MIKVWDRLYIGDQNDCKNGNDEWSIIHACKYPCFDNFESTSYLVCETSTDLYLNLIDSYKPLFMPYSFQTFFKFIKQHYGQEKKILIHCNKGESRSPSLALLFLAKTLCVISNHSYDKARKEFTELFDKYNPSLGIQKYFYRNWKQLNGY